MDNRIPQQLNDLWLKSSQNLPPHSPTNPPSDQNVADLLAQHPWMGWTNQGEVQYQWDYVDRPEHGTALITFIHPANRAPPPDGIRYLAVNPPETVSSVNLTVHAPASVLQPNNPIALPCTLTCYTSAPGHFPPTSRNSALLQDSPEQFLTRQRRRYHISRGAGHPSLFFIVYLRVAANQPIPIPQGWNREPVRAYPLSKVGKPTDPVFIFGGRNRLAGLAAGQLPGAMSNPIGGMPPQQQQQQQQQQTPQTAGRPTSLGAMPPALAAQYHHHAQAAYTASLGGQQPPGSQPPPQQSSFALNPQTLPNTLQQQTAFALQQQHQSQMLLAQAQQQQVAAQHRARLAAAAGAQQQSPTPSQLQQMQVQQQQAQAAAAAQQARPMAAFAGADVFDMLNAKQLAMNRIAKNADVMTTLFDPLDVDRFLERAEKKMKKRKSSNGGLEERKKKLLDLREKVERETREEEEKYKAAVKAITGVEP